MSNQNEHPRRARNSPNNRSHPSHLDQYGRDGDIPKTEAEAMDMAYNGAPSQEVTTIEGRPRRMEKEKKR
ncbi:hypothetical protein [Desmospora profundinema]|uniref:DUF3606 domain-containing protein n=1 Tax=Desmospora profundinema TaxID=1571184 RepID=A0ABU1IPP5_9BACL|nr:hypothetical protein [Desmospora profundinema]MDR6226771.1 hypothetical protein [Desmospora profundinema]